MSGDDLLVVAGEASGDQRAARVVSELRALVPGLRPFGLGGEELAAAGVDLVARAAEISVVGLTEALKVLPQARSIFRRLLDEAERRDARTALLVDFAEFNLRLAGRLKQRGLRIAYYISPQVWAWRRGRIKTIARSVDRMLVLFPFEAELYSRYGVDVVQVGHPLVDEVPRLPQAWDAGPPRAEPYEIALLPGSRSSEIEALLAPMLEAVRQMARELPVHVRLVKAPGVSRRMLAEEIELSGLPVTIVTEDRFAAIAGAHLALCASGTATLEVGLLGTPMIVLYRLQSWTYLLARLLVRLRSFGLVNLVLGREVVPELMQDRARPEAIAREARTLLTDPGRVAVMRRELGELRNRLGASGASRRAADEVADLMGAEVPA